MLQIEKSEVHVFRIEGQDRVVAFQVDTGLFFELAPVHEAVLAQCQGMSLHAVTAALADDYGLEAVSEAIDELAQVGMIAEGALMLLPDAPKMPEQEEVREAPADRFHITLHVAHACNITCVYCFAHGGDYGGKPGLMTPEVGRRAVLWALEQAQETGRCQIDFFGGEPLLNLDLIRELVPFARAHAKKMGVIVGFGMTTNGTLLTDEVRAFLKAEQIAVQISVDGNEDDHNKLRTFHNGSDTYGVVAQNVQKMVAEAPDQVSVRATLTSYNLDYEAIAGHLSGFDACHVEVAPVVTSPYMPYAIREEHLPVLKQQLRKLSRKDLEIIFSGEDAVEFDDAIRKLLTGGKRCRGCQGGRSFFSVAMDGSIYFCSSLADLKEFRMGTVFSGLEQSTVSKFDRDFHVANRSACETCWARNLCGGGCVYDAQSVNGTPIEPNPVSCEQIRYRYELAMEMCLDMMDVDETLLERRYELEAEA